MDGINRRALKKKQGGESFTPLYTVINCHHTIIKPYFCTKGDQTPEEQDIFYQRLKLINGNIRLATRASQQH